MKRRAVSGIILKLLLITTATLAFNLSGVQASSITMLHVSPRGSVADFGESFTVHVDIQDASDLYSYDVKLGFDMYVLEAVNVEEGTFLKEGTISPSGTSFRGNVSDGQVGVMCNIIGDYPGVDGNGTLFKVTFTVKPAGEFRNTGLSDLHFFETNLLESALTKISHSKLGGSFSTKNTILYIEPSDIADPTLTPGNTVTLDVKVADVLFLYAWAVNMSFNPGILRIVDIAEGDFLEDQPEGTFGASRIENERGWGYLGWTTQGEYVGVNGNGTLATVEFQVLGVGESLVKIEKDPIYLDGLNAWVNPTVLQAQTSQTAMPKWVKNPFTAESGHFSNLGAVVIPSIVDFEPDTLNLKSNGKWIKAYIELPEGYNVVDIDVSTVKIGYEIPAELHPTAIGDYDRDGVQDLMVKFNRQDLVAILSSGEATMTVIGEANGVSFEGSDTLRLVGGQTH